MWLAGATALAALGGAFKLCGVEENVCKVRPSRLLLWAGHNDGQGGGRGVD